jgi:hypothetical protein
MDDAGFLHSRSYDFIFPRAFLWDQNNQIETTRCNEYLVYTSDGVQYINDGVSNTIP